MREAAAFRAFFLLAFPVDTASEFLPKRFGRQGLGHAKRTSTINNPEMSSPGRNQRRPKQKEIKLMKTRFKISTKILSVLACFVGLPEIKAAPQVAPPPDGCYPGFTTAEGCLALQNLTTGTGNTGVGWRSLFLVGDASFNTGVQPHRR